MEMFSAFWWWVWSVWSVEFDGIFRNLPRLFRPATFVTSLAPGEMSLDSVAEISSWTRDVAHPSEDSQMHESRMFK